MCVTGRQLHCGNAMDDPCLDLEGQPSRRFQPHESRGSIRGFDKRFDKVEVHYLLAGKRKRQGRPPAVFEYPGLSVPYFLLTVFLSSAPGVNFATLRAAILIVAPVCGLRPFRAFLCDTEKVPKPIKATRSPLRNAPVMLLTAVSIAVVAAALLISQAPAILSTRSALFIVSPRRSLSHPVHTGRKKACV